MPKTNGARANAHTVIDADGHVLERMAVDYKAAFPERLKHLAPYTTKEEYWGVRRIVVEGQMLPRAFGPAPGHQGVLRTGPWAKKVMQKHPIDGMWDPHKRIPDMDLDGIDIAVCFGGVVGMHTAGFENAELAEAASQVYNNWLHDYCSPYPDRIKGAASIPHQDPDRAVKEIHRSVTELDLAGPVFPTNVRGKNLDDPLFFPAYAECQSLNVPALVHGGTGLVGIDAAGADRFSNYFHTHVFSHAFEQIISLTAVVAGGILDKYPKLRFAFLESGSGWLPYWLDRLDEHYEMLGFLTPMRQKASDYVCKTGRVFVACEAEEEILDRVVDEVGEDVIVYASDYLHFDAKFPGTVAALKNRKDLSASAKRNILGENAKRLYNFK